MADSITPAPTLPTLPKSDGAPTQLPSPPLSPELSPHKDVEAYAFPPVPALGAPALSESDPLLLRTKLRSYEPHAQELRRRQTGQSRRKLATLDRFYSNQDQHIEALLKPIARHESEARQEAEDNRMKAR